jgi:hypothetical protein
MNHKENKFKSVTIIETKDDAIDFLKAKYPKTYVITFSQEAELILKYNNNIKTTNIWKIFDYDYKKFEDASFNNLKNYFSFIDENNNFFNTSHAYFYNHFFMDSFLCREIAYYLVNRFANVKFYIINKNYNINNNILSRKYNYSSLLKFYLLFFINKKKNKINKLNYYEKILITKTYLSINIFINILKSLFNNFLSIFKFKINNIEKIIRDNNVNVITNSWGRDLSRFINFSEFHSLCLKSEIRSLNIIWNKNKLSEDSHFKDNNIYLDTDFEGIKISNFNLINRFNIFVNIFKSTIKFISFKKFYNNLNIFNYILFLNYSSLMKINCVNKYFSKILNQDNNIKIFISSHTDFPPILSLNNYMYNHTKVCLYPHSLNLFNSKNLFNNFHTILTHSNSILENSYYNTSIFKNIDSFPIGNNYIKKNLLSSSRIINKKNLNIVISTRSQGGRWTSPLFDFNSYLTNLIQLCSYLNSKEYNITIKSHPNGDFFDLYDSLSSNFKFIKHVNNGWKDRNLILSEVCDLMICYSEVPSLFIWSISEKIPTMVYDCSFNEKFRKNKHYNISVNLVYKNFISFKENFEKIISNQDFLNSYLGLQNDLLNKYSKINPEDNLLNFISTNLDQ